jgi:hypothetical protein
MIPGVLLLMVLDREVHTLAVKQHSNIRGLSVSFSHFADSRYLWDVLIQKKETADQAIHSSFSTTGLFTFSISLCGFV